MTLCLFWPAAVDLRKRNVRILTTMVMTIATTMMMTITMMTMTTRVCVYRAWGSG